MSIFRVHKNKTHPYTIIDNTSVNDKRLSAKAKGILLFLISKPNDWFITLPNLVSSFTDGTRSIRSGIDELIKHHYIIRTHVRKDNGRFEYYDYSVFEQPVKPDSIPSSSKPECRNATLDNRTLENSTLLNTNIKTNTESKTTTTSTKSLLSNHKTEVVSSLSQKSKTIQLLNTLNIKNHRKLFDLFDIKLIFIYATWINDNNFKIKNPTGFLITAIRERWDTSKIIPISDNLQTFTKECIFCSATFSFKDYIDCHIICPTCLAEE